MPKVHCANMYQCTEVRFASFFSGEFITAIIVNPPERKLAKCTSVQCSVVGHQSEICKNYLCGLVKIIFMMPKELYHKKPVKRPLTMAQPSRILKQLRLLHNFVLYLLCTTKFSLYPWALQESESTYSNNLVF